MPLPLQNLANAVGADPGLANEISTNQINKGVAAAEVMNEVLLLAIERTGVNDDGLITGEDMAAVSAEVYSRPAQYVKFLEGHGNDNGDVVSGFHYVQGDGGTLQFRGEDFIDTVADAVYHFGFKVIDGRYVNEDGAANETAADVAGWLNFFLNGRSAVFGGADDDSLHSGDYSNRFSDANREWFYAGAGDDRIFGGAGGDRIWGEQGADTSGGGNGKDRMWGGAGADRFSGDQGDDSIWGGNGTDTLFGGENKDRVFGGAGEDSVYGGDGHDKLWGGDDKDRVDGGVGNDEMKGGKGADLMYGGTGDDRIEGENGRDELHGSDGKDFILGGAGDDELFGGSGRDRLKGGEGADIYNLWESEQSIDTIVIREGDSGRNMASMDYVENFNTDYDRIDLTSFGGLTLKNLDFAGGGNGSVYYDGTYLRIDVNGDRATDMMVEFRNVDDLSADNFLF